MARGKAKSFSSNNDDVTYQGETDSENFAMGQQNPYNLGSTHFSDQSGLGNFSQSGDDKRKANLSGAIFSGNIGFKLQTAVLDVSTNTINLNTDSSGVSLAVISTDRLVSLSTGTTGTLTTITGAQRPGQRLRLYNTTGNTITITHTSANTVNTIRTSDESDFTFENNMVIDLTFDSENTTQWLFVGSAGGGTGTSPPFSDSLDIIKGSDDVTKILKFEVDGNTTGITGTLATTFTTTKTITFPNADATVFVTPAAEDLVMNTFDVNTLDRLLFSQTAGSSLAAATTGITSNAAGDLNFNIPTNTKYNFSSNGLSMLALDNSGANLTLSLFARDDETPILQLTRIDSTPTVGTQVGRMIFVGVDSSGSTLEEFARIQVDSEDLTIGSVDGSMHLQVNVNSITTAFLSLNNSNSGKIELWKNPQLQTGINFELNSNRLLMTTGSSTTFIKGDSSSVGVFVGNASTAKGTFGTEKLILVNDYFLQTQIVEHRALTADPSAPIDGSIWYNSTSNTMFGRINGVNVDLGQSGSEITTWTADHSAATFDLTNLDRLRFVSSSGAVASANDPSILLDGVSNMIFNIADQKQWFWTNSAETIMQLNRDGVNNDTVLTIETDSSDASAVPRIDIFRDDPSPVADDEFGKIRFLGTDSALAAHVYSEIAVEYENPTAGRESSSMIFATSFDTGSATQFKPFIILNSANDERIRMVEDVEIVKDIILQSGLDVSKLFFDGGVDTYLTGSASTGRINITSDGTNIAFFSPDRFELTTTTNLIINTGFLRMADRADPTAGTDEGMFYVKDVGGVSRPFFVGNGLAAVDLSVGTGGANTALSNLASVSVNSNLNLQSGVNIIPILAGGSNLGTSALPFEKISIKDIEIETGGTLTITKNNIVSDSFGMVFNTPSGDQFTFRIANTVAVILEEDQIRFQSGRAHRISVTSTAIQILAENSTDSVQLWNGTSAVNETVLIGNNASEFKNVPTGSAYKLLIRSTVATTTGQPAIGNFGITADDSANVQSAYAGIVTAIEDDTSTSRDGRMQLVVAQNNGTTQRDITQITGVGIDIQGGSALKIGFFGVTPVIRQSPAANSTAIIAALEALGIFG